MLSFAYTPVAQAPWDNRPAVSSPLSSSPLRTSSPLAQINSNAVSQRQIQSSPIKPPKFKYAARPARPNPVVRRREETQERRRQEFLQNVRQKQEDKAWKRRDVEGQFLKQSLLTDMGHLASDAPTFSESDIEDAMAFQQEISQAPHQDDEMMESPPDDEDSFDAMLAFYHEQQQPSSADAPRAPSPVLSDNDYDDLFAELIAKESTAQQESNQPGQPGQLDLKDEDSNMSW